ncbi:hypothetical protein H5410_020053 [Solanum commersonii]|uniref:VQ domain-containing protein n=1 Tax=Solanum commersonii TaxID=4109 RepID=A0A9J5ZBC3_SOLCO|nr:hypothetical protein H5410_020053 [Solanum commersonii]
MDMQKQNLKIREPIKVKYIDSPLMVNAKNATEFRTIVQKLTGKNPKKMATNGIVHECSSVKAHEIDNNNIVDELDIARDSSECLSSENYIMLTILMTSSIMFIYCTLNFLSKNSEFSAIDPNRYLMSITFTCWHGVSVSTPKSDLYNHIFHSISSTL